MCTYAIYSTVLLDPAFGKDWKINISNSGQIHATSDSIEINFATPVISTYLDKKYSKKLVYEVSIESVEDDDKAELKNVRKRSHFSNANATKILDDIEARPQSNGFDQDHNLTIFTATFNDLDPGREYKIDVSTNYNGQEVAKSVSKIIETGSTLFFCFFSVSATNFCWNRNEIYRKKHAETSYGRTLEALLLEL